MKTGDLFLMIMSKFEVFPATVGHYVEHSLSFQLLLFGYDS